jgi:hypothetical protein
MSCGPSEGISLLGEDFAGVDFPGVIPTLVFQGEELLDFKSSRGMDGYSRPGVSAFAGEAGQTSFFVVLGVPISSSNVVSYGAKRGGVSITAFGADEMRRIVVVAPALVPVLKRALAGAAFPGLDGAPGIGSTGGSSMMGKSLLRSLSVDRLGSDRVVPLAVLASFFVICAARLRPKELAMAAFNDEVTDPGRTP